MTGGGGHSDAQVGAERHELLVLVVGQVGWRHGDGVVDVRHRRVGAALAVRRAAAGDARVGEAGPGGNQTSKHPADGPQNTLGGKGGAAVTEGVGEVEENLAVPSDGEEPGAGGVKQQETIPSTEIDFKHFKFNTWIHLTILLNHGHNVF